MRETASDENARTTYMLERGARGPAGLGPARRAGGGGRGAGSDRRAREVYTSRLKGAYALGGRRPIPIGAENETTREVSCTSEEVN